MCSKQTLNIVAKIKVFLHYCMMTSLSDSLDFRSIKSVPPPPPFIFVRRLEKSRGPSAAASEGDRGTKL